MLVADMTLAFNVQINPARCGGNAAADAANCGPLPSTRVLVLQYIADNTLFLQNFANSYDSMVTVGFGRKEAGTTGKLGTLTLFDSSTCPVGSSAGVVSPTTSTLKFTGGSQQQTTTAWALMTVILISSIMVIKVIKRYFSTTKARTASAVELPVPPKATVIVDYETPISCVES